MTSDCKYEIDRSELWRIMSPNFYGLVLDLVAPLDTRRRGFYKQIRGVSRLTESERRASAWLN